MMDLKHYVLLYMILNSYMCTAEIKILGKSQDIPNTKQFLYNIHESELDPHRNEYHLTTYFPEVEYPKDVIEVNQPFFFNGKNTVLDHFSAEVKSSFNSMSNPTHKTEDYLTLKNNKLKDKKIFTKTDSIYKYTNNKDSNIVDEQEKVVTTNIDEFKNITEINNINLEQKEVLINNNSKENVRDNVLENSNYNTEYYTSLKKEFENNNNTLLEQNLEQDGNESKNINSNLNIEEDILENFNYYINNNGQEFNIHDTKMEENLMKNKSNSNNDSNANSNENIFENYDYYEYHANINFKEVDNNSTLHKQNLTAYVLDTENATEDSISLSNEMLDDINCSDNITHFDYSKPTTIPDGALIEEEITDLIDEFTTLLDAVETILSNKTIEID